MNHTILIVDDEASLRDLLGGFLRRIGHEVVEAADGMQALEIVRERAIDLVLLDQRLPKLGGVEAVRAVHDVAPDTDIVVVTAYASVATAVDSLKAGAVDYLTKPLDLERLEMVVRKALERRALLRENRDLRQKLAGGPRFQGIVTVSGVMEELIDTVARVAPTEATVLISGESGTGKELVARALHAASRRAHGPFVAVHCAALAEGLLESELFGHEKGAFTGADHARMGRFEAAAGGTMLLDEVGEIPLAVQVKLLRVLQEKQVERVGSNRLVPLDVRLVAATNRDLASEIAGGRFRDDLYYRLAVVNLHIPPLRKRRADIPKLVEHFLQKYAGSSTHPVRSISEQALEALVRYDYPGNVRELENIIESAIVLSRGSVLTTDDLPFVVRERMDEEGITYQRFEGSLPRQVENLERQLIEGALEAEGGVQCRAADRLGISERTLRYKLEKYHLRDLKWPTDRPMSASRPSGADAID